MNVFLEKSYLRGLTNNSFFTVKIRITTMNKDYQSLLSDIKQVLRSGRMKAIRQLSRAVIESYWDVGKHIFESQEQNAWGKGIVEQLSRDLQKEFPGVEGFSTRNLWDMRRLYVTYYEYSNLRQRVAEIAWGHHLVILNKTKTHEERLYYMDAVVKMAWGRDVLLNQIKANAYERHLLQPKQNNFNLSRFSSKTWQNNKKAALVLDCPNLSLL